MYWPNCAGAVAPHVAPSCIAQSVCRKVESVVEQHGPFVEDWLVVGEEQVYRLARVVEEVVKVRVQSHKIAARQCSVTKADCCSQHCVITDFVVVRSNSGLGRVQLTKSRQNDDARGKGMSGGYHCR